MISDTENLKRLDNILYHLETANKEINNLADSMHDDDYVHITLHYAMDYADNAIKTVREAAENPSISD